MKIIIINIENFAKIIKNYLLEINTYFFRRNYMKKIAIIGANDFQLPLILKAKKMNLTSL